MTRYIARCPSWIFIPNRIGADKTDFVTVVQAQLADANLVELRDDTTRRSATILQGLGSATTDADRMHSREGLRQVKLHLSVTNFLLSSC